MKKLTFLILILFAVAYINCFGQKDRYRNIVKADTIEADSVEYKLIIFDIGFDSWLATMPSKEQYSQKYYEMKNTLYVAGWNNKYFYPDKNEICDTYIEYNQNINYGLEINYRLYYYFRYYEEKNRIKLIN